MPTKLSIPTFAQTARSRKPTRRCGIASQVMSCVIWNWSMIKPSSTRSISLVSVLEEDYRLFLTSMSRTQAFSPTFRSSTTDHPESPINFTPNTSTTSPTIEQEDLLSREIPSLSCLSAWLSCATTSTLEPNTFVSKQSKYAAETNPSLKDSSERWTGDSMWTQVSRISGALWTIFTVTKRSTTLPSSKNDQSLTIHKSIYNLAHFDIRLITICHR